MVRDLLFQISSSIGIKSVISGNSGSVKLIFTVVDREKVPEVRAADLQSYADYSLYDGWKRTGWPVLTMVRGDVVMDSGEVTASAGFGRFIPR